MLSLDFVSISISSKESLSQSSRVLSFLDSRRIFPKGGGEYLIFGSESQLSQKLPEFAEIYVARKDKKKLRARLLLRESMRGTGKKMSKYTKVRYVPKDIRSLINLNVYENKVALFLWSEIPEAIIIDNKDAADSFRSYFEFMWEKAKA
ncbi:MAG: hypothetical protein Q7S74_06585 [Nanoarchaeota archaeon]|nr:hypothetical protein [Nanoarchaeota archaeon]